ncbi:MAG: hypothetical protein R3F30_00815 [Planctomycetota bacterium]
MTPTPRLPLLTGVLCLCGALGAQGGTGGDQGPEGTDLVRLERVKQEAWFAENHDKELGRAARLYMQVLEGGLRDPVERYVISRKVVSCAVESGDLDLLVSVYERLAEVVGDTNLRSFMESTHKSLVARRVELRQQLDDARRSYAEAVTDAGRATVVRDLLRAYNPIGGPGRGEQPTWQPPSGRGGWWQQTVEQLQQNTRRIAELRARLDELTRSGKEGSDEFERIRRSVNGLLTQQERLLTPPRALRGWTPARSFQDVALSLAKDRARSEGRAADVKALDDLARQLETADEANDRNEVRRLWRDAVRRFPELEGRGTNR